MAIRISISTELGGAVIKIDGILQCSDLEELLRTVQQIEGESTLDLSDLQSIDRDAIETVRDLISSGARIRMATPYVAMLLGNPFTATDSKNSKS